MFIALRYTMSVSLSIKNNKLTKIFHKINDPFVFTNFTNLRLLLNILN
jgi:hypothetical protein